MEHPITRIISDEFEVSGMRDSDQFRVAGDCVPAVSLGLCRLLTSCVGRKSNHRHQVRFAARNLSAFAITDTLLKLIAAAAIIGLSKTPNTGYNRPAATGIPSEL